MGAPILLCLVPVVHRTATLNRLAMWRPQVARCNPTFNQAPDGSVLWGMNDDASGTGLRLYVSSSGTAALACGGAGCAVSSGARSMVGGTETCIYEHI